MSSLPNCVLSFEAIKYLIHHVFLPPKLPQQDDYHLGHETMLLDTVTDALSKFKTYVSVDERAAIDSVLSTVTNLRTVRDSSGTFNAINEESLKSALEELYFKGGILPLHISAQNAGIIISKVGDSINVEAFELSPLNNAVTSTKGRLRRSFPGLALCLNTDVFKEPSLRATIAQTLATMSHQPAPDTKPKVKKADQLHDEHRDTTHPKVITELFMGFSRAIGHPVEVSGIWKNTREEVLWHGTLLRWQRSPMWLLVRVTMQLVFSRSNRESKAPTDLYKPFMAFLMARILELSHQLPVPCDLTYCMNAKLARRLIKLGQAIGTPGLDFVQTIMRSTSTQLKKTWADVIDQCEPRCDLSQLKDLDFDKDSFTSLHSLNEYLASMAQRRNDENHSAFQPSGALVEYQAVELPTNLENFDAGYKVFRLKAFETWVASNLSPWMKSHGKSSDTCSDLGRLIQSYYKTAFQLYSGNPENLSVMLLTILELWIACDESATSICGLLKDYDPGIPVGLLESLILPFREQMERLARVEDYLKCRQSNAKFSAPSIFRDFGRQDCFSVRYFDQSPEHQRLHEEIETQATQMQRQKRNELQEKKDRYKSLMDLSRKGQCDTVDVLNAFTNVYESQHSGWCKKCGYISEAKSIDIQIHEWPLPSRLLEAKSIVFELKVPYLFRHWRDTAMFLLRDILKSEYIAEDRPRATYPLNFYGGLLSFSSFVETQRIGLLSEAKPHEVTHRRSKTIPDTTPADICLNNGLQFQYYDDIDKVFVDELRVTDKIPELCTYKLPRRSWQLQQFLFRPASMPNGAPPNTVIARQSECPDHMSLEEYKALSVIPLGYEIQWQNLLVQLFMPSVDFKKAETSLVILQSIHQAGPSSNISILRAGHRVLQAEHFACKLLKNLYLAFERVKENWECSQAVSTFISLAARLLSLSPASNIKEKCLEFLGVVRKVALNWVNLLKAKAHEANSDVQRTDLYSKAVEVALVCVDSFDVDTPHLVDTLGTSEHASIFIQCSIVIQQGDHTISKSSKSMVSILHQRWKGLMYRAYPILAEQISLMKSASVDDAIKKSWSAYEIGYGWRVVSEHAAHWIVSESLPHPDAEPLLVHFDLLTGELLVNGLPLARPPSRYEQHPTYATLFQNSALEVMPTSVPGMQFSGVKDRIGYTLHFGMTEDDLLVQASKKTHKFELVPSRILHGEVPAYFVDEFVHWYDMDEDALEFRSIKDPWTSSSDNWRLSRSRAGAKWRLSKGEVSLVGVRNETAEALSRILYPLEDPLWIHIIFNRSTSILEIELPRLHLGFYLEHRRSSIQSRQFRGMSINIDQSLGALVGLRNKLILKHEFRNNRMVILPEGTVVLEASQHHVCVTIDKSSTTKVHTYDVDEQLGRLIDNGTLQSKFYICYLHALTSFCLPDPLTQRTGTEQALSILSSAAVRSFAQLDQENIDVLGKISELTPRRSYYPEHIHDMQNVVWSPRLGFLAQHNNFFKSVKSIFDQAERTELFYPDSFVELPELPSIAPDLLERDLIRSSTFRISGFGAEDHTISHDITYAARDQDQNSANGTKSYLMSSILYNRHQNLHYNLASNLSDHIWKFLARTTEIYGSSHSLESSELKYDASLLLESSEFISENWCSLHFNLAQSRSPIDKFHLMMWLSTLAFAKDADMQVLQVLASFYVLPSLAAVCLPDTVSFGLSLGKEASSNALRTVVNPALLPFFRCPEASLPSKAGESIQQLKQRRHNQYQVNQAHALGKLIDAVVAQWPCEVPSTPIDLASLDKHINMEQAMRNTKARFKLWSDNRRFYEYLRQLDTALQGHVTRPLKVPTAAISIPEWESEKRKGFVSIDDLWSCSSPSIGSFGARSTIDLLSSITTVEETSPRLAGLIDRLEIEASSKYDVEYAKDLRASLVSLKSFGKKSDLKCKDATLETVLSDHLAHCKERVSKIHVAIENSLNSPRMGGSAMKSNQFPKIALTVKQSPRLSPIFFLQQLTRDRWQKISSDWKDCIVQYGLALTDLQRAERLVNLSNNHPALIKEFQNRGHENWDPREHPESLLLEVESGIMIRDVQNHIAGLMRNPPSGKNAVMQLNMGEGKSSVILPIVASSLADGTQLVCVIVGKAQSKQMFQMLVSKLGGLLGRRVHHMPFSRSLSIGEAEADAIGTMYKECMTNGGILLVQPEHILSFKLMGLECIISGKEALGNSLLATQQFFDASSRDIVDESDENFSVKFELIYTMGMQRPIELAPERWTCIQQVLHLVRTFASSVQKELLESIEVHERQSGGFPRTRILRPDAEQQIARRLAEHICETGLDGFPIARQSERVRNAMFRYLSEPDLSADEIASVENEVEGGFWTDTTKPVIFLLRGLIAGGVLAFSLGQKRWGVNYGLDDSRKPGTKLAVPYRAKDNPTARSEFSHPDVVIVLTSLSYYYRGLKDDDLFLAFDRLLKSDQADVEYQEWVKDAPKLPPAFRNWTESISKTNANAPSRYFLSCAMLRLPWITS